MANVLNTDKQIAIIAALAEGSSIRAIERMTGVHRDTIMPKPKKVGRPSLPKGEAKAKIMPVRLNPDDRKRIEKAAKAKEQTVSEWVRSTLMAAAPTK